MLVLVVVTYIARSVPTAPKYIKQKAVYIAMPCHKCRYYSYVAMVQSLTVENFSEYDEWPTVYQNFPL